MAEYFIIKRLDDSETLLQIEGIDRDIADVGY